MPSNELSSLAEFFGDLPDPRIDRTKKHKLLDIIIIAVCGVICGADSWVEIEQFGRAKEGWLKQFLELPHGIPSHDTFGRVFGLLDSAAFQERFRRWVEAVFRKTRGQVIAIDGKTVRRSRDRTIGQDAIHLVSAWASANEIVLGQVKTDEASNEITAIPALLDLLDVQGCIVTIDAIGCQTDIARKIIERRADYVLTVKANQGQLYEDIQEWFLYAQEVGLRDMRHDYHKTVNKGHGRIEVRECWTIADPQAFDYIRNYQGWEGLQSIAMVKRTRHADDQTTEDIAFFITSLDNDARQVLACSRNHWRVENSLHWVLDVVFREDDSRVRTGYAAHNFAILRRLALSLLKQDRSVKVGVKAKRLRAALDGDFLLHVLALD